MKLWNYRPVWIWWGRNGAKITQWPSSPNATWPRLIEFLFSCCEHTSIVNKRKKSMCSWVTGMGMLCKFVMQRTIIFSNLTENLGKGCEDAHHQAEQASEHKLVKKHHRVRRSLNSGGPKFSDHVPVPLTRTRSTCGLGRFISYRCTAHLGLNQKDLYLQIALNQNMSVTLQKTKDISNHRNLRKAEKWKGWNRWYKPFAMQLRTSRIRKVDAFVWVSSPPSILWIIRPIFFSFRS